MRSWSGLFQFIVLSILCLGASPSLEAATYGQEVMASVLLAEARGEGESGMMAVAEVIRRRADQRRVSILATLEPGAFSSLNGTTQQAMVRKFRNHPLYPTALRISGIAYNQPQRLGNQTRGATHFTHKREKPYWAVGESPVATIGNHAFYRISS
jgi:hypothetical protein